LFSGARDAPKLAEEFALGWQLLLVASAVWCLGAIVLRSRWMRLASIIWFGSVLGQATASVIQGGPQPLSVIMVLGALTTLIGVAFFRERAA
jgi:hypothetical protein